MALINLDRHMKSSSLIITAERIERRIFYLSWRESDVELGLGRALWSGSKSAQSGGQAKSRPIS